MALGNRLQLATLSCFLLVPWMESSGPLAVEIPQYAFQDNDVHLDCRYELENDTLYSVRWYKDGHEFVRFLPENKPPIYVFDLPGAVVDVSSLDLSRAFSFDLLKVSPSSSGTYTCEVTGQGSEFKTAAREGEMVVAVLPKVGPKISGGKYRYKIGDTLNVNCTSASSSLPTKLDWLISGEPADPSLLRDPYTEGINQTILGLQFRVTADLFKGGEMRLKCLAWISTIYCQSYEMVVKKQQISTEVLPIQNTSSIPNKSHVVGVQEKEEARRSHVLMLVCIILAAAGTNFF